MNFDFIYESINKLENFYEYYAKYLENMLKRLDKLESVVKGHQELLTMNLNIFERIEFHKNMQIDENRKLGRLIEELQEKIKVLESVYTPPELRDDG